MQAPEGSCTLTWHDADDVQDDRQHGDFADLFFDLRDGGAIAEDPRGDLSGSQAFGHILRRLGGILRIAGEVKETDVEPLIVGAVEEHVVMSRDGGSEETVFGRPFESVAAGGGGAGEFRTRGPDSHDGIQRLAEFEGAADGDAAVLGNERPAGAGQRGLVGEKHRGKSEHCGKESVTFHRRKEITGKCPGQGPSRCRCRVIYGRGS